MASEPYIGPYSGDEIVRRLTDVDSKQPIIQDLETIRANATNAYHLPQTGIPKSDLSSGVKTSLNKADAAAPQATTYTKTEIDTQYGITQAEFDEIFD